MKIRILGYHGSKEFNDALSAGLQRTTCGFLVDDTLMVDAGAIGSRLRWDEQERNRTVLLTHLHFDHIKELPTLADNLARGKDTTIQIASTMEVLQGLQTHIFNGAVYPDFFRIPTVDRPIFQPRTLALGHTTVLSDLKIKPIAINHTASTVGYLVSDDKATFLCSGDTFETEELWHVASSIPSLKAAFIETSYPDEMGGLAARSWPAPWRS